MNIALEYMKRTGSLSNFLNDPTCLYLESFSKIDKLAVKIQISSQDSFKIQHWILTEKSENLYLPKIVEFEIDKDLIFLSPYTIVENYKPLEYKIDAVKLEENRYDSPIENSVYQNKYKKFFNSDKHNNYKIDFLWDAFTALNFNGLFHKKKMSCNEKERKFIIRQEKKYLSDYNPLALNAWKKWYWHLSFPDEIVAAELIFSNYYLDT